MDPTSRILKNSLFLTLQPFILNIVSIFAIGYMARVLGYEDYGRFIFAFSFAAFFTPVFDMGLSLVLVREVAAAKGKARDFIGNMTLLRLFPAISTMVVMGEILKILGYPPTIIYVGYIATLTYVLETLSETMKGGIQAFEKMEFVAITQFVSGIIQTVASVLFLYLGLGLLEVSLTYPLGKLIDLWLSFRFLNRLTPLRFGIDISFWKRAIKSGAPFLAGGLLTMATLKMDVLILSQLRGEAAVAIFGAASGLFYRLALIPIAVANAFFPAMASIFKTSGHEAQELFRKVFTFLLLISLPLPMGTLLFSSQIIHIIYGEQYQSSALVLKIISLAITPYFLSTLSAYCLGAVHLQNKDMKASLITLLMGLPVYLIMIYYFGILGAAIALTLVHLTKFSIRIYMVCRYFGSPLWDVPVIKAIGATLITAIPLYMMKEVNILILVPLTILVYMAVILFLRLVSMRDFVKLYQNFFSES